LKFLLDTHALLWWLADDKRLGSHARRLIEDPANNVIVSMVSLWEIAVKVRIGKLSADVGEIADAIERGGFILIGVERSHLKILAGLPTHHRDPFDHLLIAQAIDQNSTFISDDGHAKYYPVPSISCFNQG
jgi:PIN domain nuclease of toxin-antitoxin system